MVSKDELWLRNQVGAMLKEARERHGERQFERVCNEPYRLAWDWCNDFAVRRDHDCTQQHPEDSVTDYGDDVSGQYLHAVEEGELDTLVIMDEHRQNDHKRDNLEPVGYRRDYFTLFHEFGHYLQRRNEELSLNRYIFDDEYEQKQHEERACDIFAARCLVPETVLARFERRRCDASTLNRIFLETKASRPVVARAVQNHHMLEEHDYITVVYRDKRVWARFRGNGYTEYRNPVLLPIEEKLMGYERTHGDFSGWTERLRGCDPELIQRYSEVSIAKSEDKEDGSECWFIVIRRRA